MQICSVRTLIRVLEGQKVPLGRLNVRHGDSTKTPDGRAAASLRMVLGVSDTKKERRFECVCVETSFQAVRCVRIADQLSSETEKSGSPTKLLEVFKAFLRGIARGLLPGFLLDDEVFRTGDFVSGFEDGLPVDVVVSVGNAAAVNGGVVGLDVESAAAARKSAKGFFGGKLLTMGMSVIAPPDVDLSDDARIAVVEEGDPSGGFGAVDVLEVARVTMETDEGAEFGGFFSADAHFFSNALVGIFAFADATFETTGDDEEVEADFIREFGGRLQIVALNLVETEVSAGSLEPDVVKHRAEFFGAVAVIAGEFNNFETDFGNPLDVLRERVVIDDVAKGVELEPDRDVLFILLVFGKRGAEGAQRSGSGGAKTSLKERTTIHYGTFRN